MTKTNPHPDIELRRYERLGGGKDTIRTVNAVTASFVYYQDANGNPQVRQIARFRRWMRGCV